MNYDELEVDGKITQLVMISDLHGLIAPLLQLDEILDELRKDGPVQVVVLGDLVPGGIAPLEVIEWVMDRAGPYAVLGNHDEKVLACDATEGHLCVEEGVRARVRTHHLEYLQQRKHMLDLLWHGYRLRVLHGHLLPNGDFLGVRDIPEEQVRKIGPTDADLVAVGHTHYPFVSRDDNLHLANTGSTGRLQFGVSSGDGPVLSLIDGKPYDGDEKPYSSFIHVTANGQGLQAEVRKFNYDRKAAVEEIRQAEDPYFDINKIILEHGIAHW